MRFLLASLILMCSLSVLAEDMTAAKHEAMRRGDYVELIGAGPQGDADAVAKAMAVPETDDDKWYISVVTGPSCKYCEQLKADFAASPKLQAFVNVSDHRKSWAHYAVYRFEDQTQEWRFAKVKIDRFPTIVIQPPLNGRFGKEGVALPLIVGYNGDDAKLASEIRRTISSYVAAYERNTRTSLVRSGPERKYDAPFSVLPPETESESTDPLEYRQNVRSAGELADLILSFTPFGAFRGNELLLIAAVALGAVLLVRKYRESQGKTLLIDAATAAKMADVEKALVAKLASKYGLSVQSSPG